ncbi:hypothetical protein CO2235_MP10393 [Cupriavidus oxalaticus]|uniref:Uncharacterized protein n=1 Tax=Cupriavidus oxalaticus TaxID=96344 RepID=A0A375GA25_9BURK|nr:hypothetical protein CO2235_MP10393 [Cupriavidus oxalaticus]
MCQVYWRICADFIVSAHTDSYSPCPITNT